MCSVDRLLKILGDRNRLRILNLLSCKTLCVCELAYVVGIAQPSVSRHLKKLKDAGLIEEIQNSFWTDYVPASSSGAFRTLWTHIHPLLKKDPQFQQDLKKLKTADRTRLCCR